MNLEEKYNLLLKDKASLSQRMFNNKSIATDTHTDFTVYLDSLDAKSVTPP